MTSARLAFASLVWLAAAAASAQPLSNPSVDELVEKLSRPSSAPQAEETNTRSFAMTAPPQANTNLCMGEGAAGQGRNFTVESAVPYAPDGAANVDLDLRFATGSDALSPKDMALLGKLAAALKGPKLASARFAVAGHTDRVGSDDLNLRLSCARALSAQRYLVAQGVQAQRLTAYGFGPFKPVQQGAIESSANRRVEIRRADN